MALIENFKEKAKGNPKRIVFPEGKDARIVEAAILAEREGIARPILLGRPDEIKKLAEEIGLDAGNIPIVNPKEDERLSRYAELYSRDKEELTTAIAGRLIKKELFFGGMMVACGDADGMVAGASHATATVIQVATLAIGFEGGVSTSSSFFIMELTQPIDEDRDILIFADAAVNIDPNPSQLADIAVSSGKSAKRLLGIEPSVALLSFSTKGSASHPDVDKVVKAKELAKEKDPSLSIDGEFQADSALIKRVAEKKVKEGSDVAGRANVLIFPDLDAANIAYKLTQYIGGAKAYGPILQGFAKPVNDLSRGASVEDIVGVTAITVIQSQEGGA